MKRETKSKILNILFIISLIICLYLISDTYAKYVEEVNTSYQSSAKGWKVVVNDKIIREQTTLSDVITPRFDSNVNMKDGLIVPGREGYFDMEINFEKVGVPFTVDLNVEQEAQEDGVYTNLPDFKYLGYSLEESEVIYYNLPDGSDGAEGYKQLDFLQTTGTQYIDTGVKGSIVNKVESKYVASGTKATFNDITTQCNTDDRNILIFGQYTDNSDPESTEKTLASTKIYGFKIYMDNIVIREFVPCYRVSDNVKGMYDMITGNFLTVSGEGEFSNNSKELDGCVIDPESDIFTGNKAHAVGYVRWIDGDGTDESPEDELDNTEDTAFIDDSITSSVKYNASIILEQYIKD